MAVINISISGGILSGTEMRIVFDDNFEALFAKSANGTQAASGPKNPPATDHTPIFTGNEVEPCSCFKERLAKLRQYRGHSQRQLAIMAKVSYSTIQNYERGTTTPNMKILRRLAKALDCRLSWLESGQN